MNDQVTSSELSRLSTSSQARAWRARRRARLVLVLIAIVSGAGATGYWYVTKDYLSTDDAYTDGHAVTVAPRVSGMVVSLDVSDNQPVKAGDVLFRIDPASFQAARDQAAATLQVAQAQLGYARLALDTARITYPARLEAAQAQRQAAQAVQFKAQANAKRQRGLPRDATTQQDRDNAEATLREADAEVAHASAAMREADLVGQAIAQAEARVRELDAQVALSQARLDQANLNLSWTRIVAPVDGWVTKRGVETGN